MPGIVFTLVPPTKIAPNELVQKESIDPKLAGPEGMKREWCEIHGYRGDSSFPSLPMERAVRQKITLRSFPLNPGCLIGILKMAHYNPHITGQYIPLYTLTDQGSFFSLLKCLTGLPAESHYDPSMVLENATTSKPQRIHPRDRKTTQLDLGETVNHNKDLCFC